MTERAPNLKKAFALLEEDEEGEVDPERVDRALKEELLSRLKDEKYLYYEPNGKCEEFISAVGSGKYFVILFSAANGVGKTASGANVVANIVFEKKNPWFDAPLYQNWPYPKKGRIVTDPKNTEGVIDTLETWLPKGRYSARKAGKAYKSQWRTDTGWSWDVMTYEQEPKEFEGPTLGWVWFDEPPTRAIYKACVSRLRKGGIIFISATMLKGSGWIYDHIVEGRTDDPEMEKMAKGQRAYIEAGVESACIEHGVRGHLEHDHIQKMIAEYDEDEKVARVEGRFQHMAGLVFKTWRRNIHVIKPFTIDIRRFCVYEAIDPHQRTPDAVLWMAVDSKGRKFLIDELYLKCANGTEELARNIKEKAAPYRIVRRIGDPSMFIEDQHTGRSLASRLSDYGLNYVEATKMRAASNKRIEEALSYVQLPTGEFIKEPEMFVFDTLKRTIWEIEHWVWDEWTGKNADKHDAKEKPVDKDDHMIENGGRLLIQEPVFVPYEPPRYGNQNTATNHDPYE
jgi:phage terminase large subunit-like protein